LIDASSLSDNWLYGEDPKRYPFDTGRLRRVIEMAAKASGWGRTLAPGHGLGIAAHRSFVSYAAVVVEVAMGARGRFTIPRVDIAFDCGAVVNPDRVRAQLEGAVVQGIALATVSEITFAKGRTVQMNFDTYELTRMDAAPREIRTHLVNTEGYDNPLGGVGEPGVPPVAPALTNAIFAATGKRIRALPIGRQLMERTQ
jgi:isoquinoline 1-oxidoreductase beta subunit